MEKRKLILRNFLSPGDIVLLTAAVRDLHATYPGRFLTDVRTSCPELWENNPHLTPLADGDPTVEQIDCHYPLIHRSNDAPCHSLHGFADFLGRRLNLDLQPTRFRGDIHLSEEEQRWKSIVHELAGRDLPFWIVNAGGKFDFTIKWWDHRRYQRVIDHFRDRLLFVQVGEIGHYHPPLRHVVDLRGKTDLRELVRLVYHAEGVLCGVTALMHLAAAVPLRPDRLRPRAAVIVAGGREPAHWEAYPGHQFLHTTGALPCCASGGCWRSRTRRLGDGAEGDRRQNLCCDVTHDLPRCMDMITAEEVIRCIELYVAGEGVRFLSNLDARRARQAIDLSMEGPRFDSTVHLLSAPRALARAAAGALRSSPSPGAGRGIAIMAPGSELHRAVKTVESIRDSGSALPIECWIEGPCDAGNSRHLRRLGVVVKQLNSPGNPENAPARSDLRHAALTRTRFQEVLVVEAGLLATVKPDVLFLERGYVRSGALLAAQRPFGASAGLWRLCRFAVPSQAASGALMLLDRRRCRAALRIWGWILKRMYFFCSYVDGDAGAFQLALRTINVRPAFSRRLERSFSVAPSHALLHRSEEGVEAVLWAA